MQYIGKKKIKSTLEEDKAIVLTLEDDQTVRMNKELFEIVVSGEEGEGDITDVVRAYFAKTFLTQLAYYDLDYYMAEQIAQGLHTLAHNLREEAIQRKFEVDSSDSIKISDLI